MLTEEADLRDLESSLKKILFAIRELKSKNPKLKSGYWYNPGSILNAYIGGDLSFDEAVAKLEEIAEEKKNAPKPGHIRLPNGQDIRV